MADLVIEDLRITYGGINAVDGVTLCVGAGEFLTLLGPSGCGKSTTLFAIAGLNDVTAGKIKVGDTVFFDSDARVNLPPEHRNVGLVFQSYALWPHMTVGENLAFPLKLRKIPEAEHQERITEALSLVEMERFISRYPFELSGGQQQRVALARALVYRPGLLLLDEPLSNLDAKLRERARVWLRELQEKLKITTIYVTHDQSEALAVSDRIAVMSAGRVLQHDEPQTIYTKPDNIFVADFIGSANFLDGVMETIDSHYFTVKLTGGVLINGVRHQHTPMVQKGQRVKLAIRPENISLAGKEGGNIFTAKVHQGIYLGASCLYELSSSNGEFRVQSSNILENGENVNVCFPPESVLVFPVN